MKGINDVLNRCIIKCITNRKLTGIKLINGGNSGRNEITRNYGELRDVVCLKPTNRFK